MHIEKDMLLSISIELKKSKTVINEADENILLICDVNEENLTDVCLTMSLKINLTFGSFLCIKSA